MSCRGWTPSPLHPESSKEKGPPLGSHAIHASRSLVAKRPPDRVEKKGFLESCCASRRVLAPAPWSPWVTGQPSQQDGVECGWNPSHLPSLRHREGAVALPLSIRG